MQIRVDVDDHIDGSEELMVRVEGVVEGALDRFQEHIARVAVHLSQLSRREAGDRDMSCRMEAYAGGLKPIEVSHEALTLTEAIHSASAKLERAVQEAFNRAAKQLRDAASPVGEGSSGGTEGLGHVKI
jgi:ribosome-associated translation inhibitor RaiA